MLIGISTENFSARPTPLSQDIIDICQFNVKAIEIIPKTPADFQNIGTLKNCLKKFEHISVLLPPPPLKMNHTSQKEIPKYYDDAFQFSVDINAQLVMIRPDFQGSASVKDLLRILQALFELGTKRSLKVAVLNWFSPGSQCGTFEQVSEILNATNCKFAIDFGHAHQAMDSKSVQLVVEQKSRLVAVRASDATTAFSDLPLGTGHVNYPVIMPILEESGFSGPFFVTHKRDPSLENIRNSISFLEYFEL